MERRKQILTWIKEILDKHLVTGAYQAFVFGSQANLKELKRADIDIGIIRDGAVNDSSLARIYEDIETLPMLYNIDVVDFNKVDDSFKDIALQNVEVL